jgi:hypothetical protein
LVYLFVHSDRASEPPVFRCFLCLRNKEARLSPLRKAHRLLLVGQWKSPRHQDHVYYWSYCKTTRPKTSTVMLTVSPGGTFPNK